MNPNRNQQPPANVRKVPSCVLCKTPMQPVMQMPVRVGGPEAGLIFFRDIQELDERILILDTYRCPNCRRLEFFDLDMSLPNR